MDVAQGCTLAERAVSASSTYSKDYIVDDYLPHLSRGRRNKAHASIHFISPHRLLPHEKERHQSDDAED